MLKTYKLLNIQYFCKNVFFFKIPTFNYQSFRKPELKGLAINKDLDSQDRFCGCNI